MKWYWYIVIIAAAIVVLPFLIVLVDKWSTLVMKWLNWR